MNRKSFFFHCLLSGALLNASPALRAQSPTPLPTWLTANEVNAIVRQEPPPPAPVSREDQADLKAELKAQNTRTPARIAEARLDAIYSLALFFNEVGFTVNKAADPHTQRFYDRLYQQADTVMQVSKEHWRRPRPFITHSEIHPLFTVDGYSYPSGHTITAFVDALVLGQLFPDRARAALDRARKIVRSRVDAGVHYESDIKEGEIIGGELARELLARPDFQNDLEVVKVELKQRK